MMLAAQVEEDELDDDDNLSICASKMADDMEASNSIAPLVVRPSLTVAEHDASPRMRLSRKFRN